MSKTESNSTGKKNSLQPPQSVGYTQPFVDENIDLYEMWITIWNKKWIVIGVTAVAALGSVVFALLQPLVYKAEAYLLPPKAQDIQSLNVHGVMGLQEMPEVSPEYVFASFKKNLSSRILQKKFIKDYGLMEVLSPEKSTESMNENVYEGFSKIFKIKDNTISIELNDPEVAALWVNDYIKFMDNETIRLLVDNVRNSIMNSIRDIEYTISSKRQMAKQRRKDKILLYTEATSIAIRLGVKDRVDTTNVIQNNQLNISTGSTPLYYRGYRALNAELDVLKNRKSDDAFASGLRDLQENIALLSSIKITNEGLSAVTIDQAAYAPKNRIKPNRRMIVTLGTVVGLFLGLFMVFFVSFIQNKNEDQSE